MPTNNNGSGLFVRGMEELLTKSTPLVTVKTILKTIGKF